MSVKIIVNGAKGKMGSEAVNAILANPAFTLVGKGSRHDDLSRLISETKADVVVDLTSPDSVFTNTKTIIESGARPVIGTTGLTTSQIQTLTNLCEAKRLGGIIAPNFSISAVLMMKFSAMAARFFESVEIIEKHHPAKKDSPSGTAIKTAELIAATQKSTNPSHNKQTLSRGDASHGNIPIHSVRISGIVAEQQVIFGGADETLLIEQKTSSRKAFMPGLLLCCEKVMSLNSMSYGIGSFIIT